MRSSNNNQRPRKSGTRLTARILALVLALLMVGGSVALLLQFLLSSTPAYAYTKDPETGQPQVRIGLMYGNDVTVGFQTTTDHGFEMGVVDASGNYYGLMPIYEKSVSVTCDNNLGKSSTGAYYLTKNQNDVRIATFHLAVYTTVSASDVQIKVAEYNTLLTQTGMSALGVYAFPAYVDGTFYVYIGNYPSKNAAISGASKLSVIGLDQYTIEPGSTASISVVNPVTDRILFEFDSFRGNMFAMKAVSSGTEKSYIKTPAGNTYAGYFRYNRYYGDGVEGVAVTNVLPLEEYLMGVLPYEISNVWPIEAQKSFAVTVRSYTLSTLGRHEDKGFDLCNTTHCQVYKGRNRINENVLEAVNSTAHQILTYNGKIASVYYSSSCGGTTVSVADAWGGSDDRYPYLQAIATPWENYEHYNHGSWTAEVTPTELCQMLQDKGYTNVSGAIADVKINQFATNSTYVYSITFTDVFGKTETIKYSDKIRVALSEAVYSANFVVGRVGEVLEVTDYVLASEAENYPGTVPDGGGTVTPPETDAPSGPTWWSSVGGELDTGAAAVSTEQAGVGLGGAANTDQVVGGKPQNQLTTAAYDVYDIWNVAPSTPDGGIHVITDDGEGFASVSEYVHVVGANGSYTEVNLSSLAVITGTGTKQYDMAAEIRGDYSDVEEWKPTDPSDPTIDYVQADIVKVKRYVLAEGTPGNFVFVGRGWGHGVGISQYGNKDMAEAGYTYDQILYTYCRGTKIMTYEQLGY